MEDLGFLRYFPGIEVAHSLKGFSSQGKYLIDLLEETGTWGSKPIDTLKDPNIRFDQNLRESLADPGKQKRLIGKLIYLTVTWLDIIFAVSV